MYKIYSQIQRRVNRADLRFHISGPYCYGDDPKRKRGYSFDMNFDSRSPKQLSMLALKGCHACNIKVGDEIREESAIGPQSLMCVIHRCASFVWTYKCICENGQLRAPNYL